jgi:hypothetical protein
MTENLLTAQELEEAFGKVDFEKLVRDEILKECAEEIQKQYDRHLMTTLYGSSFADSVMIHPEVYKNMKYNRPMNIFEKLQAGCYWFGECFDEWCYTMMNDDGEFFNYIQSDYCKYEEDMYYETH